MKKVLIIVVALSLSACGNNSTNRKIAELEEKTQAAGNKTLDAISSTPDEKPTGPLPVIEFDSTNFDFGTIPEGQKVTHVYKVKNVGEAPLTILNIKPSCGCTSPDWTKTPIAVGGTGTITIEFNTQGKAGMNRKSITVLANTWPKTSTLNFTATVTKAAAAK